MAIDPEAKKIVSWAETGDRTDPDDAALTPVLNRSVGWPSSFSSAGGNRIRRTVMNQVFRELTGAVLTSLRHGIPPYDADINYFQGAVIEDGGTLYRATEDVTTGADGNTVAPSSPGQTLWAALGGETGVPSVPNAPIAVVGQGELTWEWDCPKDNGAAVTSFQLQWRTQGTSGWPGLVSTTKSYLVLAGQNGITYEARVQAINSEGSSGYGSVGVGTPAAEAPGTVFGLVAVGNGTSGEVELSWAEPDDGGEAISNYTLQWRTQSDSYATSRQQLVAGTTTTLTGFADGTEPVSYTHLTLPTNREV